MINSADEYYNIPHRFSFFFYVLCIFRTGSCAIDFLALNNYKLKFPTHFQFFYLAPKNFRSESQLHMIRLYIRGIFFVKYVLLVLDISYWHNEIQQYLPWTISIFISAFRSKNCLQHLWKLDLLLYFLNCFVHYFGFLSNNCIVEILSVLSRSNPGPDGLY